jgi:ribonuclease D
MPQSPSTSSRSSVSSWFKRAAASLFGKETDEPEAARPAQNSRPVALTKAETALLEPFVGLPLEKIIVPKSKAECAAAAAEILAAGMAGFDTEAKPTFRSGEKSSGPHVVQFALSDKAFIFQLHRPVCEKTSAELIASERVVKVGFGLKNDHGQIRNRLGVVPQAVIDLDLVFRQRGYKGQIGVRAAMGAVLHRSFPKSKSITTSNWAAAELSPKQLRYAANDAYAALKIKEALDRGSAGRKRSR